MTIRTLLMVLIWLTALPLWSQQTITVQGNVYIGEALTPLPAHPVEWLSPNGMSEIAYTDNNGHYNLTIAPAGDQVVITTADICTDIEWLATIPLQPNQNVYTHDFFLCEGVDPPVLPDTCVAFFYAEQLPTDASHLIHFFDVSFASGPIWHWLWDFGDNTTADEPSPTHNYAAPGTYTVTLTIADETGCTATYSQQVIVTALNECDCPEDVYAPVCVDTPSGATINFANSCYAECAGFGPDHYYACDGNCNCTQEYDPVCVVVSNTQEPIQFTNPCEAACAGYSPDHWYHCSQECVCDLGSEPVCVTTPYGIINFPNICVATDYGFGPDQVVDCPDPTNCEDAIVDPVCVHTPDGEILHFINACVAINAGFGPDTYVPCDDNCICPDIYDPVCVATPSGMILTFGNSCEAECEGFTADMYYSCSGEPVCNCPEYYLPVCVYAPNGDTLTFDNPCFATCAGYTNPFEWHNCIQQPNDCICPDVYDPVCVETGAGIVTFGNSCEAACFGFDENDFVLCENNCFCPAVVDPVCVPTECGPIVFPNPCAAVCYGFSADQYYHCNLEPTDCIANFFTDIVDPAAGQVLFHDTSVSQGPIWHWLWDFGDGHTGEGPTVMHQYATPGTYTVTLTIIGENCESTTSHHIHITHGGGVDGQACQAMFFFQQNQNSNPLAFQFTDMSLGTIQEWHWNFGDGHESTVANPQHTYTTAGTYLVTLTVQSANCQSTITLLLVVGEDISYEHDCQALFLPIIEPDSLNVFFLNLSSADAVDYLWDYGDGSTDTSPFAYHEYDAAGTYEVNLTITTANGCTNTYTVILDLTEDTFLASPPYTIISATTDIAAFTAVQMAPNPTNGESWLHITTTQSTDLQIDLLDSQGRLLGQQTTLVQRGGNPLRIDLHDQPAGLYFIRLQSPQGSDVLRLIKL